MDAITMLREDHRQVEKLFKQFEKLAKGGDEQAMRGVVDEIVTQLSVHAAIEEQVFYPAVRKWAEDTEDTVLEGLEEHHIVKWTLSELDGMKPSEERFKAKVTVLIESVRHHVEEEEQELFPAVREAVKRKDLQELGETLEAARKTAPTRPHPKAPDEPPGNLVANPGAAVDKTRDRIPLLGRRKPKAGGKS
ncbi:MAG TPA: hemerythrin domain-containing protein [Mycobacteriales bacterium]|jgi:hemerythrin superfamily protein|nr:hemerythrin domain-containing protein [Mycobacteriales bacterium]